MRDARQTKRGARQQPTAGGSPDGPAMAERAGRSGTASGEGRRRSARILVVELRNGGRKYLRKGEAEREGWKVEGRKGRTVPWLRLVPSDLDLLIEIARLSAPARPPHGSEGVGQGRVLHTGGPSWTRLGSAVKAKTDPTPPPWPWEFPGWRLSRFQASSAAATTTTATHKTPTPHRSREPKGGNHGATTHRYVCVIALRHIQGMPPPITRTPN